MFNEDDDNEIIDLGDDVQPFTMSFKPTNTNTNIDSNILPLL